MNEDSILDPRANILIVDDTPANLRLLSQMLMDHGYKVRPVPGGALALAAIESARPDLILLDINMPGMNGYQVCSCLKEKEETRDIPIIFISALDEVEGKVKAFTMGGVDYITKPFHLEEVVAKVETHLSLRNLQMQLRRANQELEARVKDLEISQDAVQKSEDRYRTLVEISPDMILWINGDGEIIFCNKRAAELDDRKLAAPLMGEKMINFIVPEDRSNAEKSFVTAFQDAGVYTNLQYQFIMRSGRHFLGDVSLATIVASQGDPRGLVVIRDITERSRLEQALVNSQKMASLGTLAAGVAHEINSPLQVITGLSQRLMDLAKAKLEAGIDQDYYKDLEMISRNSWRVANIVRSLLTYTRHSTGNFTEKDFNQVVYDSQLFIDGKTARKAGITLKLNLAEGMPPIFCDENTLSQVLFNLLNNARDAMPPVGGQIIVSTEYQKVDDRFILKVSDSGAGIPVDIRDKIFDPFFTTKPLGQGTGLGLSIVLGIVQVHGGDIEVESEQNKGTTFTVYLPRDLRLRTISKITSVTGRFDDSA